jgi:prepilin-type N-terminal cleavage/methylation domain-containing protein
MSLASRRHAEAAAGWGFSLPELLVASAVLLLLAGLALREGGETLALQEVEAASRRLAQGIERARAAAEERGRPCGLSLAEGGWVAPVDGGLEACTEAGLSLGEGVGRGSVVLSHNLPAVLRFSSNGLVLDGGTVVLTSATTELRRCLVMALPLGVVRLGRYTGPLEGAPDATACRPDPLL